MDDVGGKMQNDNALLESALPQTAQTDNDSAVIDRAMRRYRESVDSWRKIHDAGREDDRFLAGDQWPEALKRRREAKGRPCHVINKIKTTVRRVVNENRRNRPQIRVTPVDNNADVDTANVVNGLLKSIAYCSDAEVAYDTAMEHAVAHGFGWMRIVTDYVDDESFEQEIRIERVADSYSVLVPIHLCRHSGFADAPYVFVVKDIGKEEFERKYGTQVADSWYTEQARRDGWIGDKTVRVAEYFESEDNSATLYQLVDGSTTKERPIAGEQIINTRETTVRTWKYYLLTAGAVLERKIWPGKWHPLVPILGEEMIVDGEVSYLSLVRPAIDPQRMYNYWRSCETEMIALAPKSMFVGARGQFEGYEKQWQSANTESHAYLEYNAIVDATGQAVLPPPRRVDPPQIPTGYVNAAKEAADDIKAVTGVFDASLGSAGNETSGVAIRQRQAQADISNYHFADNMARALRQVGKIILDIIPTYYDTARAVRIIGDDNSNKLVEINKPIVDNGKTKKYDLRVGKYDVMVDVGPAYQSRREEAVANMIELLRTFPQLTQITGDLVVENMDFPGARDVAERIRKTLPPQLIESKDNAATPTKGEVMQILGDLQKLQQQVIALEGALADKNADRSLKVDLAILQAETAIQIERMRSGTNIDMEYLRVMRDKYTQGADLPPATQAQQIGQPSAAREQPQTPAEGEHPQIREVDDVGGSQNAGDATGSAGNAGTTGEPEPAAI